ncbi:dihydroxyacetone kinase [Alkalihalobacillus alcalophilus ATCC 27647 = CGMCC 1.3604]|uniref:phosphoenolpyruvate--glycerone phosphotransferase n=1 Tax=Alkalihalobacillus alcalophilus ATCC 27647 = CGMCC 1.3604 TaxID=1218173 RepID=A0A4S4JVC0_ALKAL|nr:dihydroxyacetone kinase subunit DhaL [Alkalihalobacillus alcalophilus]MED1561987.1 dihydroxyacetone kinase subunit DhaL [Alkalihalobacillus alcalophilus]THG89135.1 dihydroxyacetone kinase [Alkalihalobacillus alcalophilus ATCC 27647 = CGMCC 1.3604]
MNTIEVKWWIKKFQEKISSEKSYLTDLDQAIGDGDHGHNMARGTAEAVKVLEAKTFTCPGNVLKAVAMTFISKIGGASGPLYGSAFLKISQTLGIEETIKDALFISALREGEKALRQRGKAVLGEKTMIDVWSPVVAELEKANSLNHEKMRATAESCMKATEILEAKKGRAAYLGKRSVGHIDAGAYSSYLLFLSLAETLAKRGE